jgi:hypothetical protein
MKTTFSSNRGSLLIVAMLLSAIIALVLTSYIKMASNAVALSYRAAYSNQAMNLTESGLEEAMLAINNNTWASPWTTTGANATATFSGFTLGPGVSGTVKVYVQNYSSSSPLIVSEGIVTPPQGDTIVKMVEVSGLIQRSLFSKGMVGRNGLSFTGNASVDSWNSNPTNAASGSYTPVDYSATTKNDAGSIASTIVTATESVQNGNIWGTASVAGSSTSLISVGPNGSVGPWGTAAGRMADGYVSANFTDSLPNVTNPTIPTGYAPPTISSISTTTTLPRTGDTTASDGKYYYYVGSVDLSGNDHLTIDTNSNVVMIVTAGVNTSGFSIGGNALMTINSGGTVAVYTASNISIGGNGLANNNVQPYSAQFWGTDTQAGRQTVSIAGNGTLRSVIYAPNAAVSIQGNGGIYGAVVGYTDTVVGNAAFHYDESLGNIGGSGSFTPSKWRELTLATDRALYASALSF